MNKSILLLTVVVSIAPLAAAGEAHFSPAVDGALETLPQVPLDLLPLPSDQRDEAAPSAPDPAATVATASTALDPLGNVGETLVALGLRILGGFFAGVAQSASTVAAAAAISIAAPIESVAIGAATLAIAGLLSALAAAAQRYGGLGAIPLFSRIAKDDIFENKVRSDIFELIRANPGVNVSEISRRLDVAWGTATHHLHKLRAERMVSVRDVGHQKCYFPNGGTYTPREMEVMSVVKSPTAKRIAELLVQRGPTGHRDVALALQLSPALVSFHTNKLVEAGVVERRRDGRRTILASLGESLAPAPRPSVHTL